MYCVFFVVFLCTSHVLPKPQSYGDIYQRPISLDGQTIKSCSVGKEKGLCVFQLACKASGGKPMGLCRTGYQFGSCCIYPSNNNEVDIEITNPEIDILKPTIPEVDIIPAGWNDVTLIDKHSKTPCGVQIKDRKPYGRIVNGSKTHHGEFPWQASIRTFQGIRTGFDHQCGGVLINEEWVATAAHCASRKLSVEIQVRLGEHDFSTDHPSQTYRDYAISKKILHPDYREGVSSTTAFESDLALLKLRNPAKIYKHVSPICLVNGSHNLDGNHGIVTGWGRLRQEGDSSDVLQKVSLPIISNRKCENLYKRAGFPQEIPDIFMCAGLEEGGRDSCNGDSGGPMQLQFPDGRFGLVGIVSWGNGCGEPDKPGVYTRMTKFLPWILKTIQE